MQISRSRFLHFLHYLFFPVEVFPHHSCSFSESPKTPGFSRKFPINSPFMFYFLFTFLFPIRISFSRPPTAGRRVSPASCPTSSRCPPTRWRKPRAEEERQEEEELPPEVCPRWLRWGRAATGAARGDRAVGRKKRRKRWTGLPGKTLCKMGKKQDEKY